MSNQQPALAKHLKKFFNQDELNFLSSRPKLLEGVGKKPNTDETFAAWRKTVKTQFKDFQKLNQAGREIRECKTIDARLINNIRLVQKAIEDDFDYPELGLTEEIFNDKLAIVCMTAYDLLEKNQNSGHALNHKQKKLVDAAKKSGLISFAKTIGFQYEAKNFAPRELLVHKQQSIDFPSFPSLVRSLSGPQIF